MYLEGKVEKKSGNTGVSIREHDNIVKLWHNPYLNSNYWYENYDYFHNTLKLQNENAPLV